jgi:hypothetical protein
MRTGVQKGGTTSTQAEQHWRSGHLVPLTPRVVPVADPHTVRTSVRRDRSSRRPVGGSAYEERSRGLSLSHGPCRGDLPGGFDQAGERCCAGAFGPGEDSGDGWGVEHGHADQVTVQVVER